MSKAILILDNIDETEIAELRANIQLNLYGEDRGEYTNCPLKPMPERKKVGEIERVDDFMKSEIRVMVEKVEAQIRLDTELLLATGYNACIDEILGGVENE